MYINREQASFLIERFKNRYIGHGHYVGDTSVFDVIKSVITQCIEEIPLPEINNNLTYILPTVHAAPNTWPSDEISNEINQCARMPPKGGFKQEHLEDDMAIIVAQSYNNKKRAVMCIRNNMEKSMHATGLSQCELKIHIDYCTKMLAWLESSDA